ncbi:hypothetical protein DM02DRAFT_647734 [Periconia macrospinosa]|uniref:Uncharacterized protein n=1 Tax=Periconia macrospinosa TaxID=97972 RepID=A0A2V1EGC4_9PLEO|nr:hypothetical protein DM02DRAFT_647734 [Periconia macrospinosa]
MEPQPKPPARFAALISPHKVRYQKWSNGGRWSVPTRDKEWSSESRGPLESQGRLETTREGQAGNGQGYGMDEWARLIIDGPIAMREWDERRRWRRWFSCCQGCATHGVNPVVQAEEGRTVHAVSICR